MKLTGHVYVVKHKTKSYVVNYYILINFLKL